MNAPSAPKNDGRPWEPATLQERREAARWAYRTILLREPDSPSTLEHLATHAPTARALRDALLRCQEARAQPCFPICLPMSGDEPPQRIEVDVTAEERQQIFERVQSVWRAFGESKPHWSVVTADEFRPENIANSIDAFYATGEANATTLVRTLERNGINPRRLRACLDFGCGVGRLSIALASHFSQVLGVDVSENHLMHAREAATRRKVGNVSFHRIEAIDDVGRLPVCDLVFSLIVLQHNPPPVMRALFLALLGRVARGGVAVIQLPTYLPGGYCFELKEYLASNKREMEMHALPQAECFAAVREAGMELLEVLEDAWTGYGYGARSNTFVLRRP